jgi:hypothetical protein
MTIGAGTWLLVPMMKRLSHHLIGVEQGSALLFSDFADNGPMWSGDGPREKRHSVAFSETFRAAPIVQVAISMWDMDGDTNQRADLKAEGITAKGFELVFRTWGDSRVARIRADWTALGEVLSDGDWELY